MYVDSTGALLPQETNDAQAAAVTANRISLMDFIKYIFGGLLEGNTTRHYLTLRITLVESSARRKLET
jgi:hypothetical protein